MLQNLNWTPLLPNSLNVLYKDVLTESGVGNSNYLII